MSMKKFLMRTLLIVMVVATMLSTVAMAASTTWIKVTIEEDPGTYIVVDESSHYLTEDTNLLAEVVAIINRNYLEVPASKHNDKSGNGLWGFHSLAMRKIMDEGLEAYAESSTAWQSYVNKYYEDVMRLEGDKSLKEILANKKSVLGDLTPGVEYKISFDNTVYGDPKFGTTYIVTVVRYGGDEKPEDKPTSGSTGTDAQLNKEDHFAYVNGYPDGTFGPMRKITREEATTIFYRLLTGDSRAKYETTYCHFSDVAATRWSAKAIATMANANVITGYPDGTFGPARSVTRAEFATIAARFLSEPYDGHNRFPDAAGHWAMADINRAAAAGWIKGDERGNFRPNDPITRAEAVTLINRMLERQPENKNDLLHGMITFTDNMDTTKWYYLAIQEAANGHDYVRKTDGFFEKWTKLNLN